MIDTALTRLARKIAYDAHFGQTDRGGTPYICHPLHVADGMPDERKTVIAILHDVLEDTDLTADDLRASGIPDDLVESICRLTRDRNIPYANYLENLIRSGDRDALIVKYADICHNMDETRLKCGKLPTYLAARYSYARMKVAEALGFMARRN